MRIFVVSLFICLIFLNVASNAEECRWYRGRPLPECRNFWLIETDWHTRFSDTDVRDDKDGFLFSGEFGYMHNLTGKSSIGWTFYGSGDDDAAQFGLRARYRFWIDKKLSLDISPGILLAGSDNYMDPKYPGFIGGVAIGYNDIAAVSFLVQVMPFKNLEYSKYNPVSGIDENIILQDGTQTSWYLGVRCGSFASAAIPVIVAILYAATTD